MCSSILALNISLTLSKVCKLLGITVDALDSIGPYPNIGFNQSVFLQQVLDTQQMFPIVLREQQHLQMDAE